MTIVDVNASNVEETGFFCMRSKPKSMGYQRKLIWLKERFAEGLKIKMIVDAGTPRGFIEYMPIEQAWRAVKGDNLMFIHCLWIVGRGKGKGYGTQLLEACIQDAKDQHKSGVAVVTSQDTWLTSKDFFIKHGFELADEAPPSFELIVKKLTPCDSPQFPKDWSVRMRRYADGLTVLRSDQCPYIEQAVQVITETAEELEISVQVIELHSCRDAQNSPSAYGVFTVMYEGQILTYHPVTKRELLKLLQRYQ